MFHYTKCVVFTRIEYVPVNPAEVKKYGVGIPLIHQLKNNVTLMVILVLVFKMYYTSVL